VSASFPTCAAWSFAAPTGWYAIRSTWASSRPPARAWSARATLGARSVVCAGRGLRWGAAGAWLVCLGLQIARTHYEESILRAECPEYAQYAARTNRIVPGSVEPNTL